LRGLGIPERRCSGRGLRRLFWRRTYRLRVDGAEGTEGVFVEEVRGEMYNRVYRDIREPITLYLDSFLDPHLLC
jgi:hypothetical protein